jgi:hypothetical protein
VNKTGNFAMSKQKTDKETTNKLNTTLIERA